MARYNKRDYFQHYVKPASSAGKPCPHGCCRGMRAHPDHYPVVLPSKILRRATDNDLAYHWQRVQGDTRRDEMGRAQILHEMQRRDQAGEQREATEEHRRARWTARKQERAEAIDQAWLAAEDGTKGNMLNRRGKEAGINERTLFTGPESRARKYASEELLNWWEDHPRPTAAHFEGRDTRIGYATVRGPRHRVTSEEQEWRDRFERGAFDMERMVAA